MLKDFNPNRYAVINEKNKREIVMLRGKGCSWGRCRFCDYHLDHCLDQELNFQLNKSIILKVTGIYNKLEVINSGSFVDLDQKTLDLIENVCLSKKINELHFECHWQHREKVKPLKEHFAKLGITIIVKIGVETFDYLFRQSYMDKGIEEEDPAKIALFFDECCLLQGIPGQNTQSMINDIEIGLKYFQRVCVNIMQSNGKPIKPDPRVINQFINEVFPIYVNDERIDILLENTAFGVGGVTTLDK